MPKIRKKKKANLDSAITSIDTEALLDREATQRSIRVHRAEGDMEFEKAVKRVALRARSRKIKKHPKRGPKKADKE